MLGPESLSEHLSTEPVAAPHSAPVQETVQPVHNGTETNIPAPPQPPEASPVLAASSTLEERIERLEIAIKLLTEQQAVTLRQGATQNNIPANDPPPQAAPPSTAILLETDKRKWTPPSPPTPEAPVRSMPVAFPSFRNSLLWLFWDAWAEARAIVRMFVDPRYHLPWSARLMFIVLLAGILMPKSWIPPFSIPILGDWLLVKLVDLLLAFVLFKWLGHEARRYRHTSPDLPPNLRL